MVRVSIRIWQTGSVIRPRLTRDEIGDPAEFIKRQFKSFGKSVPECFSWDLKNWEKEVLYKRDKSIEVIRRLYA